MSFKIRPYEARDFAAVYDICLKTGDGGEDGTHLYDDPTILGHIYAGPYVTLEPALAFVLEDKEGVCGYVLGALDSEAFYQKFIGEWLPEIQKQVPDPIGDPEDWTRSERLYHRVHRPGIDLPDALKAYPSHLHIDLLPRARRKGNGTRMMESLLTALREKGSPAVHLGMNPVNSRALNFYKKIGFRKLLRETKTLYMGKSL